KPPSARWGPADDAGGPDRMRETAAGGDAGVVTDERRGAHVDRACRDTRVGTERDSSVGREGGVDVKRRAIGRAVARVEPAGVDHACLVHGDGGHELLTHGGIVDRLRTTE